jgi:hypothetical protein
MKPLILSGSLALAAVLLLGAGPSAESPRPPSQPVISRMAIAGDDVVLTVAMPPGFTRATLQTRASLNAAWENGPEAAAPLAGGTMEFRLPRRGDMLFMRVTAVFPEGRAESPDSNYRTIAPKLVIAPVQSPAAKSESASQRVATLHFKAFIDGLDMIQIGRDGIFWKHLQYKSPHEVSLNGQSWNPSEMNLIDFGTNLATRNISWAHSQIEVISGRDVVALEKQPDGAVVHIYDTPWGAADYEFKVHLFTAPAAATRKGPTARLKLRANIDGSDELLVNAKGAHWTHRQWTWPFAITINGEAWNPQETPHLEKALLPAGVDFRTARVISKSGRGFVNVQARQNDILVSFADDLSGAATYELEVAFGESNP